MHILIFGDQHTESFGGAQVSIRLQKEFLEAAGHRVTICQPALHRPHASDPAYLDTPSIPVSRDREYSLSFPGRRTDRFLDKWLRDAEPVDIVHVQADYGHALIGYRFAQRHKLPVVHTTHTNLEAGIRHVAGVLHRPIGGFLVLIQRLLLGKKRSSLRPLIWRYIDEFTVRADHVIVPSNHFARALQQKGVRGTITVVPTGVDDRVATAITATETTERQRPQIIWSGRMSPEKRLMPFLEAIRIAGVEADIHIYGQGVELAKAKRFVHNHDLEQRVSFTGKVTYSAMLGAIHQADCLVQTSIGFETQGMTVFEAITLGTHVIISDPDIAEELPAGTFTLAADSSNSALADAITGVLRTLADEGYRNADSQNSFLQSKQTQRLIEIYEDVLEKR